MTDNLKEYPYPIGPLAESFPPLSPAQHAALVVRIAQHSFRPAVIVWREEIIFGVALLKAYKEAGVEPRFEQLADDADPTEALAAAAIPFLEMDNNARGRAAWMASEWSTRAAMAERFGVSVRLINYFAQVLSENSKAVPALQQAVREWKIKGTDAARVISRPAVVQERAVELVMSKEVRRKILTRPRPPASSSSGWCSPSASGGGTRSGSARSRGRRRRGPRGGSLGGGRA